MSKTTPPSGSTSSPTATKQARPETKKSEKSAPAKKAESRKKDGTADPTSTPAPAETQAAVGAINTQAPCQELETRFAPIISSVAEIETMDLDGVQEALQATANEHAKHEMLATSSSKLMLAYGWKTGHLLNRGKALLKGKKLKKFGTWRDEVLIIPGHISVKTAQRYMALAKHWPNLNSLLEGPANLWGAYQECGILPSNADVSKFADRDAPGDSSASGRGAGRGGNDVETLMKRILDTQNLLRNLVPKVGVIPIEQRDQLVACRIEIDQFFTKLLGEDNTEDDTDYADYADDADYAEEDDTEEDDSEEDGSDIQQNRQVHIPLGSEGPFSKGTPGKNPKANKAKTSTTAST